MAGDGTEPADRFVFSASDGRPGRLWALLSGSHNNLAAVCQGRVQVALQIHCPELGVRPHRKYFLVCASAQTKSLVAFTRPNDHTCVLENAFSFKSDICLHIFK